jgi:hypothetical protein
MKPHLPWVALTSMAVVIPMPASTAIRGGAKRPDSGRGWALEDLAAGLGCGPGGGKIGQQIPELTPGSRGQGPRHPLVELPCRQASPAAPQIFVRANLMCPLDGGRARALRFVKHRSTMSNTFRAGSHLA